MARKKAQPLVIHRSVAAAVLGVPLSKLDKVKLRRHWKGSIAYHEVAQIAALLHLKDYWLKRNRDVAD